MKRRVAMMATSMIAHVEAAPPLPLPQYMGAGFLMESEMTTEGVGVLVTLLVALTETVTVLDTIVPG